MIKAAESGSNFKLQAHKLKFGWREVFAIKEFILGLTRGRPDEAVRNRCTSPNMDIATTLLQAFPLNYR